MLSVLVAAAIPLICIAVAPPLRPSPPRTTLGAYPVTSEIFLIVELRSSSSIAVIDIGTSCADCSLF